MKLREARIINNCFEESGTPKQNKKMDVKNEFNDSNKNYSFHPYICVIAIFEEVNAREKMIEAFIQYEYIAQNVMRVKENNNQNVLNSLVWYYDNYRRLQKIDNVKFSIEIQNFKYIQSQVKPQNFTEDLIAYPDKLNMHYNENINSTIFTWNIKTIPENDYQKISLEIPAFNLKCRKLVSLTYLFSMMFKLNCIPTQFYISSFGLSLL